jgi:hypothetical protein
MDETALKKLKVAELKAGECHVLLRDPARATTHLEGQR